jgi:hypothetical protein
MMARHNPVVMQEGKPRADRALSLSRGAGGQNPGLDQTSADTNKYKYRTGTLIAARHIAAMPFLHVRE